MATFRDYLAADLAGFLDPGEFGEVVDFDGLSVKAVVDDEGSGPDGNREGVNVSVRTLALNASEVSRPEAGQRVSVNGEGWIVDTVTEEDGLLCVRMYREES